MFIDIYIKFMAQHLTLTWDNTWITPAQAATNFSQFKKPLEVQWQEGLTTHVEKEAKAILTNHPNQIANQWWQNLAILTVNAVLIYQHAEYTC